MTKADFDAKISSFNRKITANKSKHLLVENELKKLKKFDLTYFRGKSHFEEDGTQNYLVFQPMYRYFKVIANAKYISEWKSKGLSDKTIKPPDTSDNSLSQLINYLHIRQIRVKFNGGCLKQQNRPVYTHTTIVNIDMNLVLLDLSGDDSTLRNSIFGSIKSTKNADIDKYRYSGYGI